MVSRVQVCLIAALGLLGSCVPLIYSDTGSEEEDASETDAATDTDTETTGEVEEHPCGPTRGVVSEVIDGDTIELSTGQRVRYILVDTPETGGDAGVECWGPQATEFNRSLVDQHPITLHYDDECRDQYNRLLAYITVDDTDDLDVNGALIENGFACVFYFPPNGDERIADYQALEDAAKASDLGMWGACATVACD